MKNNPLSPDNLNRLMATHNRVKALIVSDPELAEHIKWLCWNAVGNTAKSLHKNPSKMITRDISDSWMEYEAGISESTIYNPYNTDH